MPILEVMPSPIKIELRVPDQISGSAPYTVSVTITNIGNSELSGVEAEPSLWAGRLLMAQAEVKDVEESELEARRRSIIKEMENQISEAYERQALKKLTAVQKTAVLFGIILDGYVRFFSRLASVKTASSWTDQAFRIHDWQDVDNLEREIISSEEEDSRLRKAFLLDKEKLSRCIELLSKKAAQPNEFEAGLSLATGSSVTFPFTGKAPNLLRRRSADIQFKVTYREGGSQKVTSESVSHRMTLAPSAFAVPTGGMIGAACGYGIRASLVGGGTAFNAESGWQLIGSILLGLVVSLLVSRKPDTYKAITAEDFLGGFLIGALSGLFSEALLEKLRLLIPVHPKS